jgi:tetratricopeptide (TPR) repeat protein
LGLLHFDLGDLERAKDFFEEALRLSQQHQEGVEEVISRMWLGRILAKMDPSQAEEAEREIRQGIQMAEERKLTEYVAYGYYFLGELYAGKGERELARQSLEKATSMYQEIGIGPVDYWLAQAQATLGKLM